LDLTVEKYKNTQAKTKMQRREPSCYRPCQIKHAGLRTSNDKAYRGLCLAWPHIVWFYGLFLLSKQECKAIQK
jgi:hypothetical protein